MAFTHVIKLFETIPVKLDDSSIFDTIQLRYDVVDLTDDTSLDYIVIKQCQLCSEDSVIDYAIPIQVSRSSIQYTESLISTWSMDDVRLPYCGDVHLSI